MKESFILTASALATALTVGAHTITFTDLPYSEGTLYLQIQHKGKDITLQAREVESDTLSFEADLTELIGEKVSVNAFQEPDGNASLDFEESGRPTEPCVRSEATVGSPDDPITLQLKQY